VIKSYEKPTLCREYPYEKSVNVIHLGLGAFYRAFACHYFHELNSIQKDSVRIMGVSLRTPELVRALERQDGLFTAFEKGPDQLIPYVLEPIYESVFAPDNPNYLLEALARPAVSLVTLTITEKGYCLIPSSGELDFTNSDIIYDLKTPKAPRSAIGFLVYSLNLRMQRGLLPFTCLSCDNLPSNGVVLSNVILEFAKHVDEKLFDWISNFGIFPSSMVDRIVPSVSQKDIEYLSNFIPHTDIAPVVHEPYSLWVIEDGIKKNIEFNLQQVGVKIVSDVEAFERLKLRCLNGTHSALAYLGYLSGFKTIFEAASQPVFELFLNKLWNDEILPTVVSPQNFKLSEYVKELSNRYKNPNIQHLTKQIAMDGSQIIDNLNFGRNINLLCEVVAGWIRYTSGKDDFGNEFDVVDPKAAKLFEIHNSTKSSVEVLDCYLLLDDIFPVELRTNDIFRTALKKALVRQKKIGTLQSLEEVLE
jgi:fructuronate reductase